jgi:hypothetical protein
MTHVMAVLTAVRVSPFSMWVVTEMWLVPLVAWAVRPLTHVPHWVRAALPGAVDPQFPAEPMPSLRSPMRIALLGGLLGTIAVAAVMAYLHTRRPPAKIVDDLYNFSEPSLLILALAIAPVAVAAATALITIRYRLLVAWIAAGVAAMVAFTAAFLLGATQECLEPLNTTSSCHSRPLVAWPFYAQTLMPPVLETGLFVAALVALLVAAMKRLVQRGRPTVTAGPPPSPQSSRARWAPKRVGIAAICMAAVGLSLAGIASPSEDMARTDLSNPNLLTPATTPVTPEVRSAQMLAWFKFGGADVIRQYLGTDMPNLEAAARGTRAASVDPAKVGSVCTEINQTKRSADAYFPMPDSALQQEWSMLITRLPQVCADFQRAALHADDNLYESAINGFLTVVKGMDSLTKEIASESGL